jgi:hypothetical protein
MASETSEASFGAFRLDPRDDADLVWFFGDARGDLGLRAQNYEPSSRTTSPDLTGDPLVTAHALAAERFDRIGRSLARMPREHARALERWCGPHRPSPPAVAAFGRMAGIAELVTALPAPRCAFCGTTALDGRCERRAGHAAHGAEPARRRSTVLEDLCVRASRTVALGADDAARLHEKHERAAGRRELAAIRLSATQLLVDAVRSYGQARPRRRAA